MTEHRSQGELEAGLAGIREAPLDPGVLVLIVRRPEVGQREELASAELDAGLGLVGDSWSRRSSRRSADGSPHPDMQLTLMSARAIALIAGTRERWQLAGDQLYVDLDLSTHSLPAGSRLAAGTALIEVTAEPHTGCGKFRERFGAAALALVNSPVGRELRLRGLNARVLRPGMVQVGDLVRSM